MGNGNAKPSTDEPNYNHDEWDQQGPRTDGDRQPRYNSAGDRRGVTQPSSPRASPRRSLSARHESPAPSAVPPLSRESTASLGQRIARHAMQQEALDGQPDNYDHTVNNGYDKQKFNQRPTTQGGAERYRDDDDDDISPEDMEQLEEEWRQSQYGGGGVGGGVGGQSHRQREEVLRQRDPVETRRRKGVTFDDDLTESVEDPRVRLPPLVNNVVRPTKVNRFPPTPAPPPSNNNQHIQRPPSSVARVSRSVDDREFQTVTKADVRDKLMNGRPRTRYAEPQDPRNKPQPQWTTDDDNTSNYSSSTASLAGRPTRIPQRVPAAAVAPRRSAAASTLPPLDPNGQLYTALAVRRHVPSMESIPVEANFYHLYHHGIQKKAKRTPQQQRRW